jgi:hypothetical protein
MVAEGAPLMPSPRASVEPNGEIPRMITPMVVPQGDNHYNDQQPYIEPTIVGNLVNTYSLLLRPQVHIENVHNFERILQRLAREFDASGTQREAEAFCSRVNNDLGVPADMDLQAYHESGDSLIALIAQKHEHQKRFTMTPLTVKDSIGDSTYLTRALELAGTGAVIEPDPEFVHLTPEQTQRAITSDIPQTIAYHTLRFWHQQRAIILPLAAISRADRDLLSFVSLHLHFKADSPPGRLCIDPSNTSDSSLLPLNTPHTKAAALLRYGPVEFPTINTIIQDWHQYNRRHDLVWKDCYIEKDDIVDAFPQVRMAALSAVMMAVMISAVFVWIPINGTFGWSGLPFAYNVFGLATMEVLLPIIEAVLHRYCDDYIGYGTLRHLAHDRLLIVQVITALFQEQALSAKKHEPPTQRTHVIGWVVDLQSATVTLKDRAWRKMQHTFFNLLSSYKRVPRQHWEAAASLAERFSQALPGMRCFVTPLHKQAARTGGKQSASTASASARFALDMWRVALLSQALHPESFLMPLDLFARIDHGIQYDLISDASTPIIAAGIYHPTSRQLLAWTSVVLPFKYTSVKEAALYQNQREYLGYLVSLLLLTIYTSGITSPQDVNEITPIRWFSDNITAQSWAEHAKARSLHSLPANIAITLLQLKHNINLQDTIHVPSVHMHDIDNATRNRPTPSLTPDKFIDVNNNANFIAILSLCNPTIQESYDSYRNMLFQFQVLFDNLQGQDPRSEWLPRSHQDCCSI